MTRHEGLLASTFADGGLGSGYAGGKVLVARNAAGPLPRERWEHRPATAVTGWVMACSCGWLSRPWVRVDEPEEQDRAARRAYSADAASPLDQIEQTTDGEWSGHIGPIRAAVLTEVSDLLAAGGDDRLTGAVRRARELGASWADLGAAAGVAATDARERWRDVPFRWLTGQNAAEIAAVYGEPPAAGADRPPAG